jgi:glycosyltransferase involved in cell wall biosynthesis
MMSLRIPGKENVKPDGIHNNETTQLAEYTRRSWPFNNTVLLANKMPHMKVKNTSVYGVPPSDYVVPNPSVIDYSSVQIEKADTPTVVFLGRLDPIKRPWLFVELGRHFPQVDFYMMGQNHFEGEKGWSPTDIPDNVHLTGHLSGDDKYRLLSRAWVLVNTSIHEESPVSVLEALAYETPVLSYEDWGRLVERHGITIGQHRGTGMDGMADLVDALDHLLSDHEQRIAWGKAGRAYVEQQHNDQQFLAGFSEICREAGIHMNLMEST